ncbi:MAG: sulfur carrier protein ThiS [Phycisphaeraceae bacterium]|nr:sulfur carrier protein ThiS [Phycisphaeraceae bacterium]
MIKLTVNGQEKQVADATTVRQLIIELELGKAAVAVEVNRELIPKKIHESTTLNEGDTVELVTLVGGG